MKRALILLAALLFSTAALAQTESSTTGTISTANASCVTTACVRLALVPGGSVAVVQLVPSGGWSGTVQFEGIPPLSTTAVSITGSPLPSGVGVTSATGAGTWQFSAPGLHYIQVRGSTVGAGTIAVTVTSSAGAFMTMPASVAVTQSTATSLKTQAEAYQGGVAVGSANPMQVSLANTAINATAVKVDNSAVTQPVSAAALPLPSGASTSAKQPALGTAGIPSTDVLTVQGVTSMTALKVDGSAVTQPVSGTFWQATQPVSLASMPSTPVTGTFWQATQPVSGTFWQTTQPVSIASMPSTPVTGTFWQATQPISGAVSQSGTWTVQPGNTANTTAWKVDGSAVTQPVSISSMPSTPVTGTFWQATQPVSIASMPSTPVTGTFWQATQPVSGTFWQATQPVSIASMPTTPVTGMGEVQETPTIYTVLGRLKSLETKLDALYQYTTDTVAVPPSRWVHGSVVNLNETTEQDIIAANASYKICVTNVKVYNTDTTNSEYVQVLENGAIGTGTLMVPVAAPAGGGEAGGTLYPPVCTSTANMKITVDSTGSANPVIVFVNGYLETP